MNQTNIEAQMKALHQDMKTLKEKASRFSTIRFLLVIGVIFFIYQVESSNRIFYMVSIILVVVFLYIAYLHRQVKSKLEDKETMIEVYDGIVKRKNEEWKSFEDQGIDFLKEDMTQEMDLDVFGKASLFQYLNVASTLHGREALAHLLSVKKQQPDNIIKRQNAVKELIDKQSFTLEMNMLSRLFSKHAKKLKKKKLDSFLTYMEETMASQPVILKLLSYIMPVMVILSFILCGIGKLQIEIAMGCFTVTLCLAFIFFMGNSAQLSYVESMHDLIIDYERMFVNVAKQSFDCEELLQLKQQLSDAQDGIRKLNQILGFVRVRSNSILFLFANGLFLMDFHCMRALKKWKDQYGNHVRGWLEAIGEMEALMSLAQLGYAKDHICFGEVSNTFMIDMKHMAHPLINEEKAVSNSLQMVDGSYVITGSNMSGKTTFLRTIGVNMILFQAGAPVCADEFIASPLSIYTSMRVHDDVSEGISTFYAEILRIKQMMEESKKKEPILVLIDEIFKGTNSADRILCAKQAIVRLHLPWVICAVSTHDFELCDLEYDEKIQARNYHFSEYYEDDRIHFDYTLKDGRCKTTNAKQLMKMAGFWEE